MRYFRLTQTIIVTRSMILPATSYTNCPELALTPETITEDQIKKIEEEQFDPYSLLADENKSMITETSVTEVLIIK